jgi:hypothetical protein
MRYNSWRPSLIPSFELKNSTLKDFQRTKWQVKSFGRLLAQNSGISAMASPGILASIIEADILEVTSNISCPNL